MRGKLSSAQALPAHRKAPEITAAIVALTALIASILLLAAPNVARAADNCPNAEIRAAQGATNLPGCRAYEQVSPTDKAGYNALPNRYQAVDGDRGFFYGLGSGAAFPGSQFNLPRMFYRGDREVNQGWSTALLSHPPQGLSPDATQGAFDGIAAEDGRSLLVDTKFKLLPVGTDPFSVTHGAESVYRYNADGTVAWISSNMPDGNGWEPGARVIQRGGTTPDLGQVVFSSTLGSLDADRPVMPATDCNSSTTFSDYGCLYISDGDTVELVNVAPNSETDVIPGGGYLGSQTAGGGGMHTQGALSDDGSRLVFSSSLYPPENLFEDATPWRQLYLRDRNVGETTLVSKQNEAPHNPANRQVYFQAASWAPGHGEGQILFSTADQLTAGAPAGGGIYSYDVASDQPTYLLPASYSEPGSGGQCTQLPNNCSGVIQVSEDLSRIYFASSAACNAGSALWPGVTECVADQSQDSTLEKSVSNIYMYEAASGKVTFIARLAGGLRHAAPGTISASALLNTEGLVADQTKQVSQVTKGSGRFFVFQARPELTDPPVDVGSSFHVWRHDALDPGKVECISCGDDPAATEGLLTRPVDRNLMGNTGSLNKPPTWITDDGQTVFFNSRAAVVPEDTNNETDAYVWENGKASLLTAGKDSSPSYFLTADSSGTSAYVASLDRLVTQDRDFLYDLYAVRRNGGFESQMPMSEIPCSGDACQGSAAGGDPKAPSMGSAAFQGVGNVTDRSSSRKPIRVSSRRVGPGNRIALVVRTPGAGRITARGAKVRPVSRRAAAAGSHRLRLVLRRTARKQLARRGVTRVRARVVFTPQAGEPQIRAVNFKVKAR